MASINLAYQTDVRGASEVYTDLPAGRYIRLFRIEPGQLDAAITTALELTDIHHGTTDYEAVSYTWDGQVPSCSIQCDGQKILVTANIKEAISALRLVDQPRRLWIDQVCINQEDIDEKSAQVSMMGEIFSKAQKVLVWLGSSSPSSSSAIEFLRNIALWDRNKRTSLYKRRQIADTGMPALPALPRADQPEFQAVQALLRRPWFLRKWTFQEYVLASSSSEIICGQDTISTDDLYHACSGMVEFGYSTKLGLEEFRAYQMSHQTAFMRHELAKNSAHRWQLRYILEFYPGLRCADDRDQIFAVLSLCKQHVTEQIAADYTMNLTEVYSRAAKAIIETEQSLGVLSRPQEQATDLPSWIPNWRERLQVYGFQFALRSPAGFRHYKACCNTTATVSTSESPSQLSVRGYRLYQITRKLRERLSLVNQTSGNCVDLTSPRYKYWNQWYPEEVARMNIPNSCIRGNDLDRDGFWHFMSEELHSTKSAEQDLSVTTVRRTMTADTYPIHGKKHNRFEDSDYEYSKFTRYHDWFRNSARVPFEEIMKEFDEFVSQVMRSRDLYVAGPEEDAYLGVASNLAAQGDWIVVLKGGDCPFVLRERIDARNDKQRTWQYIGDCYIHGIMDGEFMRAKINEVPEVFVLE